MRKSTWWWSGIVLALLLWVPFSVCGMGVDQERKVSVLTWNIHHGTDHQGRLDLERTAEVIRESGAELVALQEVDRHWSDRSRFTDQARILGEKLDMRVCFAPIYSLDPQKEGEPRREYGLAILSRYPITSFKNHELSRISSLEPERGIQSLPGFPEAVINLKGQKVHLFNTHLSWMDADLRLKEAEEMLDIMAKADHPVILTGDMNALPGTREIHRLEQEMTDTFKAAGEGDGFTYPVLDPRRRIDFIFSSREIRALDSRVIQDVGSDHYPVLSVLEVPKQIH